MDTGLAYPSLLLAKQLSGGVVSGFNNVVELAVFAERQGKVAEFRPVAPGT